jgi:hypothetical protein
VVFGVDEIEGSAPDDLLRVRDAEEPGRGRIGVGVAAVDHDEHGIGAEIRQHPKARLALPERHLGHLLIVDVRGGPEPPDDLPGLRIPVRFSPRQEPPVLARPGEESVLDAVRLAGAERALERGERRGHVLGMDVRGRRLRRRSGLEPRPRVEGILVVEIVDEPLGIGRPDDLRDPVGDQVQPLVGHLCELAGVLLSRGLAEAPTLRLQLGDPGQEFFLAFTFRRLDVRIRRRIRHSHIHKLET